MATGVAAPGVNMSQDMYNLTMELQGRIQEIDRWRKYNDENMDQMFLIIMGIIIYRE